MKQNETHTHTLCQYIRIHYYDSYICTMILLVLYLYRPYHDNTRREVFTVY